MNLLRLLAALVVTTSVAVGSAGCGVEDSDHVDVAVQPRVVLDGTIELSDRSGGRVIIDEVIAHAPSARLRAAVAGDVGDVVVDDKDPLLFRYDLTDRTGFGAALPSRSSPLADGQRVWSMPAAGAALDVAFGPIAVAMAVDLADEFDTDSVVLDGLGGHTVVIHGTIAMETEADIDDDDFGGFGDVDPDGGAAEPGDTHSDVDPDGTPANPGGSESDVDPDGGAAQPVDDNSSDTDTGTDTGSTSDVDPDGGAAQPGTDDQSADGSADGSAGGKGGDTSDVDPDGGAARNGGDLSDVDPDGTPADVDPDGGAADGLDGGDRKSTMVHKPARHLSHGLTRRSIVRVPFSLVVDGAFHREVVLTDVANMGAGEVMPIDLHLSAHELLDADRLAELEAIALAALAVDDEPETVILPVSGAVTASATTVKAPGGIQKPKALAESTAKLHVSGDLRGR